MEDADRQRARLGREPFVHRLDAGGKIARLADAEAEARERELGDRHRAAMGDMRELPDDDGDRITGARTDDIDDAAKADIADRLGGLEPEKHLGEYGCD